MWRAGAAGVSVVVAAVSGVVTALVTAHPSRGLWVALGVVVVVGALLQAAVTYGDHRRSQRVSASGAGAVAVGGSARNIHTGVHDDHAAVARPDKGDGVTASGPGSVSVGGDVTDQVSTEVTGGKADKPHDES